jgi:hypothetical protein
MHTPWPGEMVNAIDRTTNAMGMMAEALKDKNSAAADAASVELGEGSHDITHEYYGAWLPGGGLQGARTQVSSVQRQGQTASSGAHGHGGTATVAQAEGPNWLVIGGFVVALTLVILGAGLTKPKTGVSRKGSLPDPVEA